MKLFIDGDTQTGSTTEWVINPSTGEKLQEVPLASTEQVDQAVRAARKAFPGWADSPPADRARALLKLADRLDDNAAELADLEAKNVGKPKFLADFEIPFIADNLRFFAGAARCLEGRSAGEYTAGRTSWIRREPIGVVAQIAPWNYPLMMAGWKIGPALAAGNTVVLKPSELTPLTTLRLSELAADLFPPGVFNVVNGYGATVGAALCQHPEVDMVSLTGDVGTGKEVARAASQGLKRVHLELGGKAPVIIYDDADLDLVVETVKFAGYMNTGQDCTAACRIYAQAGIHDKLVERLQAAINSMVVGEPNLEGCEMGPLISARQRDRVQGFLERARTSAKHLEFLTGTQKIQGGGFFLPPTIVTGARNDDEMVQREVFGPVITVTRFQDEAQALEWANGVDYGLSSSVWTRDLDKAMRATKHLHFGCVWVNDHGTLVSEMPHGGFKQSGYGKDMSSYALDDYTDAKHVMVRLAALS
jgi:1-pyrroline dehydrogenase